ncbi:LrgB family protein [Fusibacter tunisiensis]|jgi:predicted murein hydrolase (TIGR00659 family)|uniref:Murein hydrolase (TIGR00659 family) n=1 Tax=Fusibacter tunisiensis TaxID=1008308 RepID=A0ABS2MS66_9FIRM|nr:LrgB family protein [Fusibacter tunisiensis]MBM7562249.1 putative murein hydrolase (TIGR00659 family) [Fusibacter tunisiensis]
MADIILTTPAFGIVLTILAYQFGLWVRRKTNSDLANPLLVALISIITLLVVTGIPYESYKLGGDGIHFFLSPLTVALGIMLYRQRNLIFKHFLSLIIGITSGVLASFGSILIMGHFFNLSEDILLSMLPKSITTPMALALTDIIGGIPSITVIMVIITGIGGAFMAPLVLKVLRINNPIAVGTGIGTAAHAVGTSKALEIGEKEGALSSAAIGLAGLITVLLIPFLISFF